MRSLQDIKPRTRLVLSAVSIGPILLLLRLPSPTTDLPDDFCVVTVHDLLVATTCADPDPWFGTPRERAALGTEICWWHADTRRFSEIDGIGAAVADRLMAYRDQGGAPTFEGLMEVRGVGAALAGRIRAGVTTRCASVVPRWGTGFDAQ